MGLVAQLFTSLFDSMDCSPPGHMGTWCGGVSGTCLGGGGEKDLPPTPASNARLLSGLQQFANAPPAPTPTRRRSSRGEDSCLPYTETPGASAMLTEDMEGAGQYKPSTRLPFCGVPSVITRHHETTEQDSSLASHRACHLFTRVHQRVK